MMALRPEPQTRLMVVALVVSGRPAFSAAWRAGACPTPAWRTWPMRTSSTSTVAGSRPARSTAARIAVPPSSVAGTVLSAPPNLPIGVRAALTMKTSPLARCMPGILRRGSLVRPLCDGGSVPNFRTTWMTQRIGCESTAIDHESGSGGGQRRPAAYEAKASPARSCADRAGPRPTRGADSARSAPSAEPRSTPDRRPSSVGRAADLPGLVGARQPRMHEVVARFLAACPAGSSNPRSSVLDLRRARRSSTSWPGTRRAGSSS